METYANMFLLSSPKRCLNSKQHCIISGAATQENKGSQAVIFILIFTYIEEKGDIICQVKLNAAPFTSVCLPLNK